MKQVMRESLLIKLPVIIGDLFLLNLSWILALTLYPQPACIARSLEIFACLNICFIPGLSWFGVILSSRIVPYEEIIRRVFYVVLCHLGFFVLIQTVWSYGLLPVHLMGTFYIVLTILLMLWRYTCRIVVKVTRGHGRNARRVIIVGSKDNAVEVYHEMVDNTSTGYRVLGYFSNHDDHTLPDNTPCLGSVDEALPWLEAHPVNEVYCCLSTDRYAEEIFPIMDFCENNFVRFFYVPNLRNYMKRTMNLELLGNVPILYIREEPLRQASNRFIKRAFDVTVSSLFLCTLFPFIYIFVAIGTKLTSRGPVLFLQERSGENGQTFRCIKFRSMRVNADADRVQATRDDPRKTRFGDFLRRSSIDELPQFINVLRGDMSIVGPRPHMLQHTEQYSKLINKYMVRHLIKPGITGWAQVTGYRGETHSLSQMEGRVRLDRGFERQRGSMKAVFDTFLQEISSAKNRKSLDAAYQKASAALSAVALDKPETPLRVGIVGEYYTVMDDFGNHNVEQILGYMGRGVEIHRWMTFTHRNLEYDEQADLQTIAPYVRYSMGPTTSATLAGAIRYADAGFDGIVHVKSFGCTPEVDAMAVLQNISADRGIPILYLSYDSQTGDAGIQTRLEAFYDMIDMKRRKQP